jgi:hypothetical protein
MSDESPVEIPENWQEPKIAESESNEPEAGSIDPSLSVSPRATTFG